MDISKVYVRSDEVDGVSRWHWVEGDTGTWQGPMEEWIPLKEKVLYHTTQRRTIINAGGAMGMYPKLWSPHFQRVYTFEPAPLSFYVLNLNCTEDNIFKFNAGLGHDHEKQILNVDCPVNYGMNRIGPRGDNAVTIPILRIDDFNLDDLDVIQLDIEGWEHNALLGGSDTIQRCHPLITIETAETNTVEMLTGWGYQHRGKGGYDQVYEWVG